MGIPALGSKIVSDITGCPKKAVLFLQDIAPASSKKTSADAAKGASSALSDAATGATSTAALKSKGGTKRLEVQYNPNSINIRGNAEPIPFTYLLKNVDNGVPNQATRQPSFTMSVELIFDDTNIFDAFMFEKGSIGIGSAITAVSAMANTAGGKGYSVQPQTNALVAMLMRPRTRLVTFQWADMCFTGYALQAQAKYTMFSVSGKPIRSMVQLVLAQRLKTQRGKNLWDDAFDNCFKDKLSGSGADKSAVQKAGNLLNFNGF